MAAGNRSLIELPRVNLEDILTKVPLPSLLACCAVSKSLLELIRNDSEFARVHLANSEPQLLLQSSCIRFIDLDTKSASRVEVKHNLNNPLDGFQIKDSSNELILMERMEPCDDFHRCMIYNPVTGEYTLLPIMVACYTSIASWFFYCPETNQFEVLCMFVPVKPVSDVSSDSPMEVDLSSDSDSDSYSDSDSDMDQDPVSDHDTSSEGSDVDTASEDEAPDSDFVHIESDAIGEIFVKGHDSWKSLGILPFSPLTIYSPCHLGKTIHWMCADKAVSNLIVFFNFETHEFGQISGPAHVRKGHGYSIKLALVVIGNRLSIIDGFTKRSKVSVWVMKEYGVEDSWSREYVIDDLARTFLTLLWNSTLTCRNNGEIVIVTGLGYILFYDLNKKKGRVVNHPPLNFRGRALMHTPSFISLEDVMSGSKLKVVKVAPRLADPVLIPDNYLEIETSFSQEAEAEAEAEAETEAESNGMLLA